MMFSWDLFFTLSTFSSVCHRCFREAVWNCCFYSNLTHIMLVVGIITVADFINILLQCLSVLQTLVYGATGFVLLFTFLLSKSVTILDTTPPELSQIRSDLI